MGWVDDLVFGLLKKLLFGSYKPFLLMKNQNIIMVVIAAILLFCFFFFFCRLFFFIQKPQQQGSAVTWKQDTSNKRDLELNQHLCRHSTYSDKMNESISLSAVVDIRPSFSTTKSCLLDHIQLENHTKDLVVEVVSSNNNGSSKTTETSLGSDHNEALNISRGESGNYETVQSLSPPPPLKVMRKEKLGDRITTLHQMVCPFGKNNTALVLHETIGYIEFLQGMIHNLSTEQIKPGTALHRRYNCQNSENSKLEENPDQVEEEEGPKHDLRSRGLCLVSLSIAHVEQII